MIFDEGVVGDKFYIILKGRVTVEIAYETKVAKEVQERRI